MRRMAKPSPKPDDRAQSARFIKLAPEIGGTGRPADFHPAVRSSAPEEGGSDDGPLGPLHGVPISIKDLVDVEGVPTRHGSVIFDDNAPAAADDVLVERLRQAGAIVIGKATTPEFGVKGLTDGPSFGTTRNPWDLERTPGGSSGGGAAAAAAGLGATSLRTASAGSIAGAPLGGGLGVV